MPQASLWHSVLGAPFFGELVERLGRGDRGLRLTGLVAGSLTPRDFGIVPVRRTV